MNELTAISAHQLISDEVRHYLDHALANNTRRAYKADWEHFNLWGGSLPSNPEQMAAYLTAHAGVLSIATLQRRLVAIAKAHAIQGYSDPVKNELVKLTLRGIRRIHGHPQAQAAPLMKEDLIIMLSQAPDNLKGKRDQALLLLGFCAALRRSELVTVKVEDLEFTSQGLILTLPRSKTDQAGQGRKIGIPKGRGRICPVMAVDVWLAHSRTQTGFIFGSVTKGGVVSSQRLSDRSVSNIVKHYAEKAGLNPDKYSGHSLRAGLATSAAQQGVSSWKIRAQTGHKSDAMLARYIRDGDLFIDNAAGLF